MNRRIFLASLYPAARALQGATGSAKAAGNPSAPITIELFSDFECPACKGLYLECIQPMMKDYVAPGKVYLIHRDFPLPIHKYAREAACYAGAAHRTGKYDQVCAALFSQQEVWSKTGNIDEVVARVLTPAEFKKVRALVKDPAVVAEVQQDFDLARRTNIQQTPTMVITRGTKRFPVSGHVSYNLLRKFLDDLLTK
jgi:protein-disulfide isomerase